MRNIAELNALAVAGNDRIGSIKAFVLEQLNLIV